MTLSKVTPRSRALDWPSGRETTLALWTRFAHTMAFTHLFFSISLFITLRAHTHSSAILNVPQKTQWGQRVGGVVGKPEAHGGRFRVGGQCLGHRLGPSRRTHAPGSGMGACQLRGTDSDELPGRQSISYCSYVQEVGVDGDGQRHVLVLLQGNGRSLVAVACMPSLSLVHSHEDGPSVWLILPVIIDGLFCWRLGEWGGDPGDHLFGRDGGQNVAQPAVGSVLQTNDQSF